MQFRQLPRAVSCSLLLTAIMGSSLSAKDSGSKYGPDDRLGAINLLGPKQVKEGASLVTKGKVYSLALETNSETPAYEPRTYGIETVQAPEPFGVNQITFLDDQVTTFNGIGTQIDGFGHAGSNSVHYNGVPVESFLTPNGIQEFSTSKLPPIVTRGILLDMAKFLGKDRVAAGTPYNRKEIKGALKSQNISIESGDVVIFHAGWNQLLEVDKQQWLAAHPGLGEDGAAYLASQGVVAIGADTAALEVIPFENPEKVFPVHQKLLVDEGVYILEALRTEELARDKAYEFMFVLGVPKLGGSVQAMINPIAIR
ncbi:cyclase family protein [Pseudobacteriovorax antillogorgiicola]|uniref:Kynurenine formamidase n=1 Tax=Pseudobacteriovorax antillogorgiicola TaxID=1513793 RepID=A0A1Y6BDE5_9BACT|nr:cyclase family protein [Pseudobacteriovorax antillogorgiicola]TCS56421.1 kynurenine formamidase [Pseudobacteriovorax antillogorgiicola]SMF05728.1 Kynurenine formamidase [Pseudobacteriovorax antillogorgiicola]